MQHSLTWLGLVALTLHAARVFSGRATMKQEIQEFPPCANHCFLNQVYGACTSPPPNECPCGHSGNITSTNRACIEANCDITVKTEVYTVIYNVCLIYLHKGYPSQPLPSSPSATGSSSQTSSSSPGDDSSHGSSHGSDDLSTGAKAGIGVGVALGAVVVIGIIVWYLLSRRKKVRDATGKPTEKSPGFQNPIGEDGVDPPPYAYEAHSNNIVELSAANASAQLPTSDNVPELSAPEPGHGPSTVTQRHELSTTLRSPENNTVLPAQSRTHGHVGSNGPYELPSNDVKKGY